MIDVKQFKNLKEMMQNFSDERVCRAYMEEMRWGGNPVCPHCGAGNPYKLKDGKTYRCITKTCKKDFTVTVGTIFENSKVALSTWFAAIYLCTAHKKGVSSCQLARDLGITQKTAWFVLHRIRLIMDVPEAEPLANIVEVDECYLGGKWANMHSSKRKKLRDSGKDNKTPIMGLLERNGKARLTVIGKNNFKDVVKANVDTSAIIMTDNHLSYVGLSNEFAAHWSVNHSRGEYKNGIVTTNSVEGFFSIFKRTIFGTYHQISPKHTHRYCNETSYRHNTRQIKDNERFVLTLKNTEGRLKYADLIDNQKA
jgi:transposase-like protein